MFGCVLVALATAEGLTPPATDTHPVTTATHTGVAVGMRFVWDSLTG